MSLAEYFIVGEVYWVKDSEGRYGLVRVEKLDDKEGRVLGRDVHDALVPWPVYWSDRPAHRMPRAGIYTGALMGHIGSTAASRVMDLWEIDLDWPDADTVKVRKRAFEQFYREPRAKEVW